MNLQVIRDVSRTTDYSLQPLESPGCDFIEVKWYRYLNNEDGLMATSCPSGSECGTLNQVWMNGEVFCSSRQLLFESCCQKS